jgi:putative DNA methylase
MNRTKKLIEVALPLEAINKASAREKSIRHGHPSTLHLWWARRPLAAARAVIFAQMVDDPSAYVDVLRADSKLCRKAQKELEAKTKLWEEARALAAKAAAADQPVTEPGPAPTLDDVLADIERQRLFRIIEDLVLWENTTNETVLQAARDEIWQSWRRACAENADHPRAKELFDRKKLPAFHDPFAGGGALPLEAQRLGLESHASDLNPVAVLINKAMIEIPPKFAGKPPVNPDAQKQRVQMDKKWRGAQGLAEDVRYYGQWMRDEAEKRIGHFYPKVEVTAEMAKERPDLNPYVGRKLTVIAWLWARTVKSPNPAFAQVNVPLASSFLLSPMLGREAYVEPVMENGDYRFTVKVGKPKDAEGAKKGTKSGGSHSAFLCLMSGTPMPFEYLREEARAKRMGARLMAIVAEGDRGRVYLAPTPEMEAVAIKAKPEWKPEVEICHWPGRTNVVEYGLTQFGDLFTPRQLVALTTLSDLVQEARERVQRDALVAGLRDDARPLRDGGTGATAYGDAVAVYLSFLLSKLSDKGSTLCTWDAGPTSNRTASGRSARVATVRVTFGRQALPMTWDFAEVNFFSESVGSIDTVVKTLSVPLDYLSPATQDGIAQQADAQLQRMSQGNVVSTDPPYYDNIGYADLSDFFYVWLRRSLRPVFPELFATLAVPKAEELVATPYRHGSKEKAEMFFLDGMTQAMHRLASQAHPAFPVTIYYAFKQAESDGADGTTNTGWDTFLAAVIQAGFAISGTWPMRTELGNRMIGSGTNALASSIILVCRPRAASVPTATRREFVTVLKAELPVALAHLQRGNIAPVDLAQAAIGPGMAVYTRYAKVQHAEGKPLSVREALALINQTLDEALAEQEGDFDADSRWALTWFEQSGFDEGEFGVADVLARAKVTAVEGLVQAGIVESKRGKVRLLRPEELPADWDPATDLRLSAWEIVHQLIRALASGGEGAAAGLVAKLGAKAEIARELAYRLYTLCERKKRAAEALAYNGLVQSWPEIVRIATEGGKPRDAQGGLFVEPEE